jgi:hypothetical protein
MQQSQTIRKVRRGKLAVFACLALAAAIVGCGGGGGGSSTTTSTTSTTAGAGLPINTLVYGIPNGTDTNFDVDDIAPDGTGNQTLVANVSGKIVMFAINPAVANQFIVAADLNGNGFYGLYKATSLNLTGATELVAPEFSNIASLAVTMNGAHVVFTGTDTTDTSYVYSIPTAGGISAKLALASGSTVSPGDNNTIAYVGPPAGGGDNDQVFTRSLAAGPGGAATQVTSNDVNHTLPAFSRDGHKLAWWEMSATTNTLVIHNFNDSSSVSLSNPDNLFPQGTAFNATGTRVAIVAANDAGVGQILTQLADGSGDPGLILGSPNLLGNYGIYWTDSTGRVIGGSFGMSSVTRRKGRLGSR